jgi:hypothetical protein
MQKKKSRFAQLLFPEELEKSNTDNQLQSQPNPKPRMGQRYHSPREIWERSPRAKLAGPNCVRHSRD